MSHTCGNTGNRQELPCINCDCESSARPASYDVLADRHWYWVEYEGLNETYNAPAMYLDNVDCFYSYEFSGIPRRQLKVLREA